MHFSSCSVSYCPLLFSSEATLSFFTFLSSAVLYMNKHYTSLFMYHQHQNQTFFFFSLSGRDILYQTVPCSSLLGLHSLKYQISFYKNRELGRFGFYVHINTGSSVDKAEINNKRDSFVASHLKKQYWKRQRRADMIIVVQKDFPARNAWSRANRDFSPINKGDGTEACIITRT